MCVCVVCVCGVWCVVCGVCVWCVCGVWCVVCGVCVWCVCGVCMFVCVCVNAQAMGPDILSLVSGVSGM